MSGYRVRIGTERRLNIKGTILLKENRNPYISREICLRSLIEDLAYQKEKLEKEYRYRRMSSLEPTEIEVYLDNLNWLSIKIDLYEARLRNEKREREKESV